VCSSDLVSLQQYLTYTTEKPEKLAIESYVRLYGSYPDALEKFVEHMKKSGLPLPNFVRLVNSVKEALTDESIMVLISYRQTYGDNAVNVFERDFSESGLTLSDWVASKDT